MTTTPSSPAADPAARAHNIDPKVVVGFVNAVRSVLSTMVGLPTTIGKPVIKSEPIPSYDVSGIIGFSGGIVGSAVISFQKEAAMHIVEAFAGSPIAPDSPDFADAIGELANMIAGNAKRDLGASASISCPSVIMGHGHVVARLSDVPCLTIPCSTPVGAFAVEVCIKQVQPAPK